MVIESTLNKDDIVTDEDRKAIAEAQKFPAAFDEDSPEMTQEMEKALRVAAKMRDRLRA